MSSRALFFRCDCLGGGRGGRFTPNVGALGLVSCVTVDDVAGVLKGMPTSDFHGVIEQVC